MFYINNLGSSLTDVWILTTAHEKGDAEVAVQSVFNFVFDWSKQWTLNLNADKKEVCSFSTRSNGSACPPVLFIGSDQILVNHTPRVLGVIRGRSLSFNAHMRKLTAALTSSLSIL